MHLSITLYEESSQYLEEEDVGCCSTPCRRHVEVVFLWSTMDMVVQFVPDDVLDGIQFRLF
jgi:hypothetical protein